MDSWPRFPGYPEEVPPREQVQQLLLACLELRVGQWVVPPLSWTTSLPTCPLQPWPLSPFQAL